MNQGVVFGDRREYRNFSISYTSRDRQWAEWIAMQLEEAGYTFFLQVWDFPSGSNFGDEIDKAIKRAERTLLVLSPSFLESNDAFAELEDAIRSNPTGTRNHLLLVRIKSCAIDGLLRLMPFIDLVSTNEMQARNFLMTKVQRGRGKPARVQIPSPVLRDEFAQANQGGQAPAQVNTPDDGIQQRYVNMSLVRQEDQMVVPKTTNLGTRKTYDLRLNIGTHLDDSVVENAEQYPFPVNRLPQMEEGYWLEVAIVSDDFTAFPRKHQDFFLPKVGPSWVCDCPPGKGHQCNVNERRPYLSIPIRTPKQSKVAQLTIVIYYQNNLIQSQLLTAHIAGTEQSGEGYVSVIDCRLSNPRDVGSLPPRTLHILTNANADGSHRFVINSNGDDVLVFHLREGQIREAVGTAREALRNVLYEESVNLFTRQFQRDTLLLDDNNAKEKEAFIKDLEQLAFFGCTLYDSLRLGKELLAPATIQVSRTIGSTLAFPWALVYDISLTLQGPYKVCPFLENYWDKDKGIIDSSVSCCPYKSTHGTNTLCPFGFWGFRHHIEQPPSIPEGKNLSVLISRTNQKPILVAGFSQDLNQQLAKKHRQKMAQLTQFTIQYPTSLQDIITALAASVEVVYFYCHGGRTPVANTSLLIPYLQVGKKNERFAPTDIKAWLKNPNEWPPPHWEQTSPLVFINGCHTAELTPELLINFVDRFF